MQSDRGLNEMQSIILEEYKIYISKLALSNATNIKPPTPLRILVHSVVPEQENRFSLMQSAK
jgi:hypothetical protein